jgi:Zn-dependent peptidase ImmA (M78 family)
VSSSLTRKIIQNEAERIAKEAGFTGLGVDPFKIAQDHDIVVQAKPLGVDGVSGMFLKQGDNFGILYGTHIQNEGFKKFSVAHELGHYFLAGHSEAVLKLGPHSSRAGFVSDDRFEKEADLFAASLLMPEDAFRLAMRTAGIGMRAVERLQEMAGASLTATAFRYRELTDAAVAVVLSTDGLIDVCFYSERIKDIGRLPFFRKGTPLPHGTLSRSFHDDPRRVTAGDTDVAEIQVRDWFGIGDALAGTEEVKGLGRYGKVLTVVSCRLPSDDDYDPDDDADDEESLTDRWTPRFRK